MKYRDKSNMKKRTKPNNAIFKNFSLSKYFAKNKGIKKRSKTKGLLEYFLEIVEKTIKTKKRASSIFLLEHFIH